MANNFIQKRTIGAQVLAAVAAAFAEVNRLAPECSVVTVFADEEAGGLLWLFDARNGFPSGVDTDALEGLLDAVYAEGLSLPITVTRDGQVVPDIANMTYMIEMAGRAAA